MLEPLKNQNNNMREEFANEQIPVGLPWHLLIFSAFLLGLSIFIFFGLKLGYSSYLDAKAASLDKKIEQVAGTISKGEQDRLINFYSQIINLKKVLADHPFASNIFGFLERSTLPTVYYYEANFQYDGGKLELKGRADKIDALVGQLEIFNKAPELDKVVLEQLNFEGSQINFSVLLTFRQDFFNTAR